MTLLTRKSVYFSSLILTAFSITAGSYQPVLAGPGAPAVGSAKTAVKGKGAARPSVSPPESGVQLLIGILQRIGNEPQIAMKKSPTQEGRAEEAANQIFMQNTTDPALAIRPQDTRKMQQVKQNSDDQLLAMLPKKMEAPIPVARRMDMNFFEAQKESKRAAPVSGMRQKTEIDSYLADRKPAAMTAPPSPPSGMNKLRTAINNMYGVTKKLSDLQEEGDKGLSGAAGADDADEAASPVLKAKGPARVVEYGQAAGMMGGTASQSSITNWADKNTAAQDSIYVQDMRRAKDRERSAGGDAKEVAMKLDQPGLYKYTREYGGSNSLPEPMEVQHESKSKAKPKAGRPSASFGKNVPDGVRVAYVPPALVAGIPGLRLGALEHQVEHYLRGRGSVVKAEVNGWNVWSLSGANGKTALQVYLRAGVVEAFRIFDRAYVPDRLGVDLMNSVSDMKEKFGEPAFILKEPSPKGGNAKNYVYPVSQVSFQLARSETQSQPTIQSLLLFQFL